MQRKRTGCHFTHKVARSPSGDTGHPQTPRPWPECGPSTTSSVGQSAQLRRDHDTLSLVRRDPLASGHSWQQRILCLFLSPLALGVTAANVDPFRDPPGAWNESPG